MHTEKKVWKAMPAGSGARKEEGGMRLQRIWGVTCHLCLFKKQKSVRKKWTVPRGSFGLHSTSLPSSLRTQGGALLTWRPVCTGTTS